MWGHARPHGGGGGSGCRGARGRAWAVASIMVSSGKARRAGSERAPRTGSGASGVQTPPGVAWCPPRGDASPPGSSGREDEGVGAQVSAQVSAGCFEDSASPGGQQGSGCQSIRNSENVVHRTDVRRRAHPGAVFLGGEGAVVRWGSRGPRHLAGSTFVDEAFV